MPVELLAFIRGGTMVALVGCSIFFYRFWRRTNDRLFAYFAASFVLMAISQILVMVQGPMGDHLAHAYLVRLVAFVLIAYGIFDKNLPKK